jgi:hypothetical protein
MIAQTAWTNVESYFANSYDFGDLSEPVKILIADQIDADAYFLMRDIDPERSISETTITVTTSSYTNTISGLTDGTLRADGCGVFLLDDNNAPAEWSLSRTGKGSLNEGYYVTGTNTLVVTGGQNASYLVRYIATRTPITALGQTLSFPDSNPNAIFRAFSRAFEIWRGGGRATLEDSLYRDALRQLASTARRDAPGGLDSNIASF